MLRLANSSDIPTMMELRLEVTENRLSDPSSINAQMVLESITDRGCGWVYEARGHILGFSIAVLEEPSIWALFVQPGFEGRGIGHADDYPVMAQASFSSASRPHLLPDCAQRVIRHPQRRRVFGGCGIPAQRLG